MSKVEALCSGQNTVIGTDDIEFVNIGILIIDILDISKNPASFIQPYWPRLISFVFV